MTYSISTPTVYYVGSILVKSLILFAAAGATLLAARRSSAARRALVWQLSIAGALLLPVMCTTLPSLRLPIPGVELMQPVSPTLRMEPPAVSHVQHLSAPTPNYSSQKHTHQAQLTAQEILPAATTHSTKVPFDVRVDILIGVIWLFGFIALSARLAASFLSLNRILRSSVEATGTISEIGAELAKTYGIRRRVRFWMTTEITGPSSPMMWGWIRPVVLLPADAPTWERERLRLVLLHELGHVSRCDWPALLTANLAAVLYWFHPIVWLAVRGFRTECELACDDRVLEEGITPQTYAELLLEIAARGTSRKPGLASGLTLAIAMRSAAGRTLERRLRSVLQAEHRKQRVTAMTAAAATGLGLLLIAPLAAARLVPAAAHSPLAVKGGLAFDNVTKGQLASNMSYDTETAAPDVPHGQAAAPSKESLRSAAPIEAVPQPGPDRVGTGEGKLDLAGVKWGAVKDGLQAGIRLHSTRTSYAAGQRVQFDCYIRNASAHDIAFLFGNRWYMEDLPDVWFEKTSGSPDKLKLQSAFLTGIDPASAAVLKAGEAVSFYSPGLGLSEHQEQEPGGQKTGIEDYPYIVEPVNGAYAVEQAVRCEIVPSEEVATLVKKSRSKGAVIIAPHTVQVIGADGRVHDQDSAVLPLPDKAQRLTTGHEQFAVSAKAREASELEIAETAWGATARGLQAGLRSPGSRSSYRYGETVEMEYIIRNVSDRSITLQHDVMPGVAGVISDIIDTNGKKAYTMGLPVLHTSELQQVTLQPGGEVVIGNTRMGVLAPRGSLGDLDHGSKASNWVEAVPGVYQIRHLDTIDVTGPNEGTVTLYTGYLPLQIQQREEAAVNNSSADVPKSAEISWGKSADGLRAGLVIPARSVRITDEIHTDLYINNVSKHDITINYIANDDKFFVPDLWDHTRRKLTPDWRNMTLEQKIAGTKKLKPGEVACIAHPLFSIGQARHDELVPYVIHLNGAYFMGAPGRYHVRMTAALMGAGSKWNYFPTGEVTFDVRPWG